MLEGKRIVLGVCGSISCYKAADIASKLVQAGAAVDVVLTAAAEQFIAPLTFRALTQRAVYGSNMFDPALPAGETHVELARAADAIVIAPASATTMARLAHGLADDMLSLTVLASTAPLVIAPAMDAQMWEAAATRANAATLRARGATIVGPDEGRLASGRTGAGRLAETAAVLGALRQALGARGPLAGRHVVVTAGGTQEPIDPVRYVGNRSSGKMGFAIAEAARDRGAQVTLVTGPSALAAPYGVARVDVTTTAELADALREATRDCAALVMAAAPADFRPADPAAQKIKRTAEGLRIELVPNADVIAGLDGPFIKVGFAAETQDVRENARAKIGRKGLDFIAANDVSAAGAGFGTDTNLVTLIDAEGNVEELPLLSKYEVGERILDRVARLLAAR
jgi:phosphopantothenoylcysteine decarboxylase / phosphopantothenate---cysteine ligase